MQFPLKDAILRELLSEPSARRQDPAVPTSWMEAYPRGKNLPGPRNRQ